FGEAPVVVFDSPTSSGTEASGTGTYTVDRTGAAYVTANVATAVTVNRTGGTATPGSDFTTSFPQTDTIAGGSTPQTAAVTIVNDNVYEPGGDETIAQQIGSSANYTVGGQSTSTFSITDDDTPATVTIFSGDGQSANLNQNFGSPLVALVKNSSNVAVQGVNVTFAAPASGASAVFSNSTNAITVPSDASGHASTGTFAANNTSGTYLVSATASGGSNPFVNFTLTNISPDTLSATLDGSNNLVITDTDGTKNNNLTVVVVGSSIQITDANEQFAASSISGATRSNGNKTMTIPFTSIGGTQVILNLLGGNDAVTMDLSGGTFTKQLVF